MMKILQINDMAGVGYILTKYLRKARHEADSVSFMADPFGFDKYYAGKVIHDQRIMQYHVRTIAKDYDLIHVHFSYQILPWLYELGKPIVMHYHGSEVALNSVDCMRADKGCSAILVSGEQLLQYHSRAKYLPNPVDTELFYPRPMAKKGQVLHFAPSYHDATAVWNFYGDRKPPLYIHDRDSKTVQYEHLPEYLSQFDGYVDYRWHTTRGLLTDRSKTALESLACGLYVLDDEGDTITELPKRHQPENVAEELVGIYEGILK